jgi:hypothetical protein
MPSICHALFVTHTLNEEEMVNESTIVGLVCVSFVNVIPIISGRMDLGNKGRPLPVSRALDPCGPVRLGPKDLRAVVWISESNRCERDEVPCRV